MSAAALRNGTSNFLDMIVSVVTLVFINVAISTAFYELFIP